MSYTAGQAYVVEAKVVTHGQHNGKPMTQLEIPAWGSQYPTTLYNVDTQTQALLPLGQTLKVELMADKLKADKDPDRAWNFFWSFVRVAGADEPTAQPARTSVRANAPAAPLLGLGLDKDTQIRRAVALKAAVDAMAQDQTVTGLSARLDDILAAADRFDEWLNATPPPPVPPPPPDPGPREGRTETAAGRGGPARYERQAG